MYHADFPAAGAGAGIRFDWDPATGELTGPDAPAVREMVDAALHDGYVVGAPHPTSYSIHDPLRSLPEMAAIVSQFWRLPTDWVDALQSITSADDEAGADIPQLY